ncbi:MAG: HAD-IB family phosphatase [Desulfurococcales archaeon]|nr:HAD-IB family phosphatase [Desulfurococcales archaeon]
MDGVLVKIRSSWEYLHKYFGVLKQAREIMKKFEAGEISYMEWMEEDTSLWIRARGQVHITELIRVLEKVPIDEHAPLVARELHKRGVMIGIVSGGIDLLARRVAREIGADVWIANKLLFDKRGYLVPGGAPLVGVDKRRAVKRILGEYGISPSNAMFVGDSKWDATAMRVVGYPVAYGDSCPLILDLARCRIERLLEVVDLVDEIERVGDCPSYRIRPR